MSASDAPARAPEYRRPVRSVKAEINVTPLVDVVLVLLIIFMVVAPQLESGVAVELPGARHPDAEAQSLQPISVSLGRDGAVFLDRERVDRATLTARLEAQRQQRPSARVVLKADRDVAYASVRSLFKTCQTLSFPGISLQVVDRARPKE
jgi:biopolymer transport protein TolR